MKKCKKVIIWRGGQEYIFQVGIQNEKVGLVSHITIDLKNKVLMVRDQQNIKKLFGFDCFEAEIDPNDLDSMSVFNLF